MTDYRPEPCKHGARPIIETMPLELPGRLYARTVPGPATLRYECPTPDECWRVETARQKQLTEQP